MKPRFPLGTLPHCLAALMCFALATHGAESSFPKGSGKLELTVAGKPIEVFTYRPESYADGPLIVVFHGMLRNADTYRDNAKAMGDKFHALVAAPSFETNRFPSRAYQRGNVIEGGKVKPQTEWTYHLIPPLVDELRRREGRPNMPYYFIGHSAGGQFLVRMTALLPAGALRVVAANPGAHIFPTHDLPFPYGFGELPKELGNDAALKKFLAQPLTLYLGTADVLEKELDLTPTAMKQGPTRIERGRANFKMAQELAQKNTWEFNWSIVEAPGVGHDSKRMFAHPNCETAMFSGKCLTEAPSRQQLLLKSAASPAAPK